jgi:hypothetical protein
MNRKSTWAVIGLLVLGCLLIVLSSLSAQRPPRPEGAPGGAGRFQAIKVDGDTYILLDTATGNLYRATLNDARPYSERPRPIPRPPAEERRSRKDKAPDTKRDGPSKDKEGEKVEFKDKADDKADFKKDIFKDKAPEPSKDKGTEKKEE